jgi:hypothetical protein
MRVTELLTGARRGALPRLEAVLVVLIAGHSMIVGALLLFVPAQAVRFGGWSQADPLFFPRQAGVFHLVVAAAYLLDYAQRRSVTLMVIAKTAATLFLLFESLVRPGAWCIPVSGLADGLMVFVILLVHRRSLHHPADGGRGHDGR